MIGRAPVTNPGPVRPPWLVTMVDLIALLLAMFVMLFATQSVDKNQWESLSQGLSKSLGGGPSLSSSRFSADRNAEPMDIRPALDIAYLDALLRERTAQSGAITGFAIRRQEDRLIISLPSDLLFAPGSATISIDGRHALLAVSDMLANVGNRLAIHGHTDPTPTRNSSFGSNWELSIARAVAVAAEIKRAGYRREITALGYGDSRYSEIAAVKGQDQRHALARRVDVVVLTGEIEP